MQAPTLCMPRTLARCATTTWCARGQQLTLKTSLLLLQHLPSPAFVLPQPRHKKGVVDCWTIVDFALKEARLELFARRQWLVDVRAGRLDSENAANRNPEYPQHECANQQAFQNAWRHAHKVAANRQIQGASSARTQHASAVAWQLLLHAMMLTAGIHHQQSRYYCCYNGSMLL